MSARFRTLVDMQEESCKRFANNQLFGTKIDGAYRWITYQEFARLVDNFRGALASLGLERGKKVAIIANNRVEWAVGAYATYGLGGHYVPMYESMLPKDWKFILNDSDAAIVIAANETIYNEVAPWIDELDKLEHVICLDTDASNEFSYAHHIKAGEGNPVPSVEPDPSETAGLIYTSGTTGKPKGVILSHSNIISNINAVHECFPMSEDDVSLSFLPWAHSFGQTVELHCMLSMGAALGLCESIPKLLDNLAEVKPTILFAVPPYLQQDLRWPQQAYGQRVRCQTLPLQQRSGSGGQAS